MPRAQRKLRQAAIFEKRWFHGHTSWGWSPTAAWIHFSPFQADEAVHDEAENPMKFRNKKVTALIDVRSRLEFFFGHMPGAICIPVTKINSAALESHGIARDASILVYCASGSRSAVAVQALKQAGYMRVLDGGGLAEVRRNLRMG